MRVIRFRISLSIILLFLCLPYLAWCAENQDVLRATLANGLRVVIVKNTLAPVATTQVNFLVGSNETPEWFAGMAHTQEHMMFRGSPGLSQSISCPWSFSLKCLPERLMPPGRAWTVSPGGCSPGPFRICRLTNLSWPQVITRRLRLPRHAMPSKNGYGLRT